MTLGCPKGPPVTNFTQLVVQWGILHPTGTVEQCEAEITGLIKEFMLTYTPPVKAKKKKTPKKLPPKKVTKKL